MIKLTKSNKALRLIVCTLTALFVSLSFMGCPSPYGTDLPGTEQTEQTGTETGTGSTTTPTSSGEFDLANLKNFYVMVDGLNITDEPDMSADTRNFSDQAKRNIATNPGYNAFDTIEEVKAYILSKHVKMINWATPSEIDAALRDVWQFIDDNYENNNKITIVWQEPYGMNCKFHISIRNYTNCK